MPDSIHCKKWKDRELKESGCICQYVLVWQALVISLRWLEKGFFYQVHPWKIRASSFKIIIKSKGDKNNHTWIIT